MSPLKRLARRDRDAHRREAAKALVARREAIKRAEVASESAEQAHHRAIAALMRCDRHAKPGDFDDMSIDEILSVLGRGVDEPFEPVYSEGHLYAAAWA